MESPLRAAIVAPMTRDGHRGKARGEVTDEGEKGPEWERGQRLMNEAFAHALNASSLARYVVKTGGGKMNRSTVTAAFNGIASEATYVRLEAAVERWKHESTSEAEELREAQDPRLPPGEVEFRISGDFGVEVVSRGPASMRAELEESAIRLVRRMREERGGRSGEDTQPNG